MEFVLTDPVHFLALFAALAGFAFWCAKKPQDAAVLVMMLTPFYLVRVRDDWFRVNALDLLLAVFVVVVAVRSVSRKRLTKPIRATTPKTIDETDTRHDDATEARLLPWWVGPAALLLLGGAAATLVAEPQLQLRALGELKSVFVLPALFAFAVSWLCMQFPNLRRKLLFAIVFSAAWQAAAAVLGAFFFEEFITYDMRLRGFFLSPNHLAMLLSPALVLGAGLWFNETSKKTRRMLLVIVIAIVAGLFATQSLGGIASAAFGILLLALFLRKISFKTAMVLAMLTAITAFTALTALTAITAVTAFTAIDIGPRSSLASRLMVWQASMEILKTHWLLGIGPGAFQHHYLFVQEKFPPYLEWAVPQPHNLFLAIWLSAGLLGLVGFLWLLFGITKKSAFIASDAISADKAPISLSPYLSISLAALAAIVAHGLIDTPVLKNDLALVFWALFAL